MSKSDKPTIAQAWDKLFELYNIEDQIKKEGFFYITSDQINEQHLLDARLLTKFDQSSKRPRLFIDLNLSILPVGNGKYKIAPFDLYKKFDEDKGTTISCKSLPDYIKSLNRDTITTEALALNAAFASGIIEDFLGETNLVRTTEGKMRGSFKFNVNNITKPTVPFNIQVEGAQLEIDAACESPDSLTLFEAKNTLSENDFIVRQLYYPFRLWHDRLQGSNFGNKNVRTVFLRYTGNIFYLSEYCFEQIDNYNSISLIKQHKYTIIFGDITEETIEDIYQKTKIVPEPEGVAFPQANTFELVISACEMFISSSEDVEIIDSDLYKLVPREQTYYFEAGAYLGLLDKRKVGTSNEYKLSALGQRILSKSVKERYTLIVSLIFSHKVFKDVYTLYRKYRSTSTEVMSDKAIAVIMHQCDLKSMKDPKTMKDFSEKTFERRASSVRSWICWIERLFKRN